jgi:hypothetical protein
VIEEKRGKKTLVTRCSKIASICRPEKKKAKQLQPPPYRLVPVTAEGERAREHAMDDWPDTAAG